MIDADELIGSRRTTDDGEGGVSDAGSFVDEDISNDNGFYIRSGAEADRGGDGACDCVEADCSQRYHEVGGDSFNSCEFHHDVKTLLGGSPSSDGFVPNDGVALSLFLHEVDP